MNDDLDRPRREPRCTRARSTLTALVAVLALLVPGRWCRRSRPYDPAIEAVAAIGPDLIVGDEFNDSFADQLMGTAPTVLVEYRSNGGWRERFIQVAAAVRRDAEAAEVDAAYGSVIAGRCLERFGQLFDAMA